MQELLANYLRAAKKRNRESFSDASSSSQSSSPHSTASMRGEPRSKKFGEENESSEYTGSPHFLILGVQKAGTMAVVKNMNKHPDVNVLCEVHYFDLKYNTRNPR